MASFRKRLRSGLLAGLVTISTIAVTAPVSAVDNRGPAATIRYTEYGIPHIVAADYQNLGFGQGWAAAKDNLCLLALGNVALSGESSQYFGPDEPPKSDLAGGASTNLAGDLYFRGVNETGVVERLIGQQPPLGPSREVRDLVRGYAAGYNKYLREATITDPACQGASWLRPISELDVYRRMNAVSMIWGLADSADFIVAAQPPGATASPVKPGNNARDGARDPVGSNGAAFAGTVTASGAGISLENAHLSWQSEFRFWQAQLTIPGELDVSGVSFLGLPALVAGHTGTLAWSGTSSVTHPLTIFELPLAAGTPTTYLVDGVPEPMTRRDIAVTVRRPDGSLEEVTSPQWWTRYGPVLTSAKGVDLPWTATSAYVMADANAGNLRWGNTMVELDRAGSVAELEQALRATQGVPWYDILAADSTGASLYTDFQVVPHVTDEHAARCNTPLGREQFAAQGLAILDGSRSGCAWGTDPDAVEPGLFGPSRMPTLRNAPYVENSNDSPWLSNPDSPLVDFPRIMGADDTERNPRTRSALTVIGEQLDQGPLTRQAVQEMILANRSYIGELTRDATVTMCRQLVAGGQADLAAACDALAGWDLRFDLDSRGALLFTRYFLRVLDNTGYQPWADSFNVNDPVRTPSTLDTADPRIAQALTDAVAELRNEGIPLDGPLGENQYVVRNGKKIPMHGGPGALGVLNTIEGIWEPGRGYTEAAYGSAYLHVIAFNGTPCPDTVVLLPVSQSTDSTSPHYSDQTELYSRKEWITERYCEADILASPALTVIELQD